MEHPLKSQKQFNSLAAETDLCTTEQNYTTYAIGFVGNVFLFM